jgi:major membrane immunogen (membrane-anchored lipoprotein)
MIHHTGPARVLQALADKLMERRVGSEVERLRIAIADAPKFRRIHAASVEISRRAKDRRPRSA